MKQTIKTEGSRALPYVNVGALASFLVILDDRFKFGITKSEIAQFAPLIAWMLAMLLVLGRIFYRGVRLRLERWAGVAVLLFTLSATAEASPARIVVECAKYVVAINAEISATDPVPTDECERPRIYFDIGVQFGGVAFNLRPPRDWLAGFNAGTGYGFRWLPDFWKLSESFLSIDVFINGGFASQMTGDVLMLGLSGVVSMMNLFGGGFGYSWQLGFRGAPDSSEPIGLIGVVTSF